MTEVSRTTHEAITALVDDLAQHMERQNLTMDDRTRAACLTLLGGLHATGQLRLTAPNDKLPNGEKLTPDEEYAELKRIALELDKIAASLAEMLKAAKQ